MTSRLLPNSLSVPMDRDTPLLLPPNLRDWVPAGDLVHFILDAVDAPTCAGSR